MFYDGAHLDIFFRRFGESVAYTKSGTTPVVTTIRGIFDEPGTIITVGAASVYVERPQIRVKTSDVPNITNADSFTIRSTTYKVAVPTPDGTGITTVVLADGKR